MVHYNDGDVVAKAGVLAFETAINSNFGFIPRIEHGADVGIDAHIEVTINQKALPLRIRVQIKSGRGYFRRRTAAGDGWLIGRFSRGHVEYWTRGPEPVILCAYNPEDEKVYWQHISPDTLRYRQGSAGDVSENEFEIAIPQDQTLDYSEETRRKLLALAFAPQLECKGAGGDSPAIDNLVDRDWIFAEFDAWFGGGGAGPLWLLCGEPGAGKSIAARWLLARDRTKRLVGWHFCSGRDQDTLSSARFVRQIAWSLICTIDGYAAQVAEPAIWALLTDEANKDPVSAFRDGVLAPLKSLGSPTRRYLLVDAADEALDVFPTSIPGVLARSLDALPEWLRLVVVARRDERLPAALFSTEGLVLGSANSNSVHDVRKYVQTRVPPGDAASLIADKAKGNFLYAELVCNRLLRHGLDLSEIATLPLPGELGELYRRFFGKMFPSGSYLSVFRDLLAVLIAAAEPIGRDFLLAACAEHATNDVDLALQKVSSFLYERLGRQVVRTYALFHPSFAAWLAEDHEFRVDIEAGNRLIAGACAAEIENWKAARRRAPPQELSPYALAHFTGHLLRLEAWEQAFGWLASLDYLETAVSMRPVAEAIADLDHAATMLPHRPRGKILAVLARALVRDMQFLAEHPECLFQSIWNATWWHDSEADEPSPADDSLWALLAAWRAEKEAVPEFMWMRALRPPAAPDAFHIHGGVGPVKGLAWFKTQQQERILAASTINEIRFWDARTFEALPGGYADGRHGIPILCASPDGQHLLFIDRQGGIAELSLLDDRIVPLFPAAAVAAAYAPESRRIALADWDGSICTVNLDAHRAEIVLAGAGQRPIRALAWSVDGHLAYFDLLGDVTKVRRLADGEELTPVLSKRFVSALAWSPDGKRLAVASGGDIDPVVVEVYDLDHPWQSVTELVGYASEIQSLAWSPAGNSIAAGLASGVVVIRKVAPQAGASDPGESPGEILGLVLLSEEGELRIHIRRLSSSEIWDAASGSRIWVSPKHYYYRDPPGLRGPMAPLSGERWRCLRAGPYTGIVGADADTPRMWLPIAVEPGDKDGWLTLFSHKTLAAAIGNRIHLYQVEDGIESASAS
ncbi:MAG: DUF4365 domain-containing protein [Rhodopila sp.]|jgi:hypothetical protein